MRAGVQCVSAAGFVAAAVVLIAIATQVRARLLPSCVLAQAAQRELRPPGNRRVRILSSARTRFFNTKFIAFGTVDFRIRWFLRRVWSGGVPKWIEFCIWHVSWMIRGTNRSRGLLTGSCCDGLRLMGHVTL